MKTKNNITFSNIKNSKNKNLNIFDNSDLKKKILSYLDVKDCYYFGITSIFNFVTFRNIKFDNIVKIDKKYYNIPKKWKNIKFYCDLTENRIIDFSKSQINLRKYNDFYKLNLSYSKNINLNLLQDVKDLEIKKSSQITFPKKHKINKLNILNYKNQINLNKLKDIKDLNISFNPYITDVSLLSNVTKLNISFCNNITDVSKLKNLKHLNIKGCEGLTDITMLGNVEELLMGYSSIYTFKCDFISNKFYYRYPYSYINNDSIKKLTEYNSPKKISLIGSLLINDVYPLRYIENIDLSYCLNIYNIEPLKNVKILNLTGCFNITDISTLCNVEELIISKCTLISDVSNLTNVKILDVSYCDKITEISNLINLKELNIAFTNIKINLLKLINLKELIINNDKLINVDYLLKNNVNVNLVDNISRI